MIGLDPPHGICPKTPQSLPTSFVQLRATHGAARRPGSGWQHTQIFVSKKTALSVNATKAATMLRTVGVEERINMFVAESEIDYVGLWEIISVLDRTDGLGPGTSEMERALFLVHKMLERGFVAVCLAEGGKNNPWPEQGFDSVLQRIEREWLALGRTPNIADICWFALPDDRR